MSQPDNADTIQPNPTISAESIGHSQEILENIFLRLPAKSLISLKIVSKQWLSWISSPKFVSSYALVHPPTLSGFFLVPKNQSEVDETQIEYFSLGYNGLSTPVLPFSNFRNIKILQSCNGLLLCCHNQKHYVINPTTKRSEPLPSMPDQMVDEHGLDVNFSSSSPFCYTLAFDPENSPYYKIICVRESAEHQYKIAIYSSKTKLWRTSNTPGFCASPDLDLVISGVYCKGAIRWRRRCFDMEEELIKDMPELPRKEHYTCEYFGHSGGYLYCVFTMEGLHHYELFEMEKDYSAWSFKCKIQLDALASNFPKMTWKTKDPNPQYMYQCHVLSVIHGRDNGKDVEIIMSVPGEVIAFNCTKKTTQILYNSQLSLKDREIWYGVYHVYDYFDSLSSVSSVN